jgi:cation diffusion facilitator CzcD-associated flavoprotein CzcO
MRYDTIVIGGGQAGLAVGHYLARHDLDFMILDAGSRVGNSWRRRWDSLQLFTPARYSGLPGMAFPDSPGHLRDKDQVADYLERYAERFELPVRLNTAVRSLTPVVRHLSLDRGLGRRLHERARSAEPHWHQPGGLRTPRHQARGPDH